MYSRHLHFDAGNRHIARRYHYVQQGTATKYLNIILTIFIITFDSDEDQQEGPQRTDHTGFHQ